MKNKMKFIDLFAGVGGFHLGINKAHPDWECVYSNEWDKYANSVYKKHFGECDNRDIREVDATEIPFFDLLCAGFPCQAFSIAGKRQGFQDTRGTLFFEIARIAKYRQPRFLLLENVKGLISHDNGKTLEVILETLQELGYYVNWNIYNSKNYGVPQNRERIIFICKHIREIISVGQNQKITSSEQIIQDYLFQLLLNNLAEVKKLQEIKSKDWVIGYLLFKEIYQNLNPSEENIKDGILIGMEENKSLSTEELWQSIDFLLKKHWEENYLGQNKYTISTAIKEITDWKTYTFLKMSLAIYTLTDHLRNSQKNLWNEILSSLIVIKENTKYARLNNQKEKEIVSESGTTYEPRDISTTETSISQRNLRGTPRPEVFPITRQSNQNTTLGESTKTAVARTLTGGGHSGGNHSGMTIIQLNHPKHSNDRIYADDGISPTLNTMQGGMRQPKIAKTIRVGGGGSPFGSKQNWDSYEIEGKIRRLTPIECERLQGFPDNWTSVGDNNVLISDSQRYKMCGNAVTTNVITTIIERLISS